MSSSKKSVSQSILSKTLALTLDFIHAFDAYEDSEGECDAADVENAANDLRVYLQTEAVRTEWVRLRLAGRERFTLLGGMIAIATTLESAGRNNEPYVTDYWSAMVQYANRDGSEFEVPKTRDPHQPPTADELAKAFC